MDLQQAIIERDKTITKQQNLSNLQIPKINYSKQDLRTGMQGRVQRKEHKRFIEQVNKQKIMYAKQRVALENYISSLQVPPVRDFDMPIRTSVVSSPISSPVPTTSFLGNPRLGKIRNIKQRGRR